MKKILFVTGNANKVEEAQEFLHGYEIVMKDLEISEVQGDAESVAKEKAKAAFKKAKKPLFVEDTSVEFNALNGFPGPYIKHLIDLNEIDVIPRLLKFFPDKSAVGISLIAYADSKGKVKLFRGTIRGQIVEPRGNHGFAWDSVFEPKDHDQTLAEMTFDQKNAISHRRKSFFRFKRFLDNE